MFKKKVKKDQGVLNLQQIASPPDEEPHKNEQKQIIIPSDINYRLLGNHIEERSQNLSDKKHDLLGKTLQIFTKDQNEQIGGRRNKNQQLAYLADADEYLQNGPKKRLKDSIGIPKQKHIIGGNSLQRQAQIGEAVHSAFEGMNFKAGARLIEDLQLPASQLQEELAKRRYMENVQATRQAKEGRGSSGIYKGQNAYTNHKMTKNDLQNAQDAYKKKMGPSRVNSTIKNSCRFDYVLNLCKDWHDSGYCPFGNSCLYLHDRSNYKTGWQLEKDFQIAEKQRWQRINNPELARKEDKQKLLKTIEKHKPPQNCPSCSEAFHSPVEVQCGHLYCTPCAIKLVKCKQCGKRLSGIMNNAEQKLQKQKALYDDMVIKLQASQEDSLAQRRKFQNTDSLDVFAD